MKSYLKCIRFEHISLEVEQSHPKDISRVIFKIIEENNQVHKTKKYGTVTPINISWVSPIQFKYTAQPSFKFETICEHEYGYEIEQLKALYYGSIQIKPEDFFITNCFSVYNKSGQRCGKVSFMIKIADRQIGVKYNEDDEVQNRERIRVDLVARMTFVSANLEIHPLFTKDYEGKKCLSTHSQLILKIDGFDFSANQKAKNKWVFNALNKFELFEKSDNQIIIKIVDEGVMILDGVLLVQTLLKNKRFITQSIAISNEKGIKIGTLKLEMRVIQKKQILDLMYSPRKLQNTKMQKTDFQTELSRIKINEAMEKNINSSEPILQTANKRMSLDFKPKDMTFTKPSKCEFLQASPTPKSRNKQQLCQQISALYFKNQCQDIKFSKSKRFKDIKPNNPNISYTGQYEKSDFSPQRRVRDFGFSQTQRVDFTKQYKNNPGIGNYHLPSIWERY